MNPNDPKPTDTLANERTFLAYIRTGLAFIAFGFVIARFALFTREMTLITHQSSARGGASTGFGIAMALVGSAIVIVGGFRYADMDRSLRKGGTGALSPRLAYAAAIVVAAIAVLVAADLYALR